MAASVIDQQVTTRVSVVFWVKENQDSPYQGLLAFTPEEFAKVDDKTLQARQLEQFEAWKIVRDTPPKEITRDDKERMLADVRQQKDAIAQAEAALLAELDAEPDPKAEAVAEAVIAADAAADAKLSA